MKNREGKVWMPVLFKEKGQTYSGFVRIILNQKEKPSRMGIAINLNRGSQGPRTVSDADGGLAKTSEFSGTGYGLLINWEFPIFESARGFIEGGPQFLNLAGKASPDSNLVATAETDSEVRHAFFSVGGGLRKVWQPFYLSAGAGGWQSMGSRTFIGGTQVTGDSRPFFFHFFGEAGLEWGGKNYWRLGLRYGIFSNTQPVIAVGNLLATWGFAL
jgi:hypothetical protein